jgi:hypothetical protein
VRLRMQVDRPPARPPLPLRPQTLICKFSGVRVR